MPINTVLGIGPNGDGKPVVDHRKVANLVVWRLMFVGIFLFTMITQGLQLYSVQLGDETRDKLISCVEPGNHCSNRNAKNTAKVVQKIIEANSLDELATRRVVVAAEACSHEPEIQAAPSRQMRIDLLQACVDEEIKRDKEKK